MVKFRIGLTVSAETLFSMMAKMLPIEDLNVEEVRPMQQPRVTPKIAQQVAKLKKPKQVRHRRKTGLNLQEGVNGVLMAVFADGQPHKATEFKEPVTAAGYSHNGIGSRLERLKEHKVVFQPQFGMWQLTAQN